MMEKHGEIREGITPPEVDDNNDTPQPKVPQDAVNILKQAQERFARLEEHMTRRAHTRVTDNLR